jgi:hypothetical protein
MVNGGMERLKRKLKEKVEIEVKRDLSGVLKPLVKSTSKCTPDRSCNCIQLSNKHIITLALQEAGGY